MGLRYAEKALVRRLWQDLQHDDYVSEFVSTQKDQTAGITCKYNNLESFINLITMQAVT